jgi:Phage-related lysozyme (muraminidase)
MNISQNGIDFIRANEGFSATVYDDNGHPCIGYGCDLTSSQSYPNGITEAEATQLLVERVQPILSVIAELFPAANQNQVDALCDFGYNLGVGALRTMMSHGIAEIPHQMVRWDYDQGKVDPGLLARRVKEVNMYLTPVA